MSEDLVADNTYQQQYNDAMANAQATPKLAALARLEANQSDIISWLVRLETGFVRIEGSPHDLYKIVR